MKLISLKPKVLKAKMADSHHVGNRHFAFGYISTMFCSKFCIKIKNPSTMPFECQKFGILIIQDGGRIFTETLRTQML